LQQTQSKEQCYMFIVIVLPDGRQVDALLLSASPVRLRMIIRGRADTTELQLTGGEWTTGSGGRVELGAILAENSAEAARVLGNASPLALSAG
jgi:hypothetical protein